MKYVYNDENKARILLVADRLLGSCGSVDDRLQEEFGEETDLIDFDQALLEELDDAVQQCECCGWWVETGSCDENDNCEDCADGDDE